MSSRKILIRLGRLMEFIGFVQQFAGTLATSLDGIQEACRYRYSDGLEATRLFFVFSHRLVQGVVCILLGGARS